MTDPTAADPRPVLVTGATSMLGTAVVAGLLADGWSVRTLQRSAPPATTMPGAEHRTGSVADPDAVSAAMDGCGSVVHLAARVAVTGPAAEFRSVNIDGTHNVITAAQQTGATHMVHVSTPSVAHAGDALVGAPAGPANPFRAVGHYAQTKAAAELEALGANRSGFAVTAVRPHLVWGPGDQQLIGRIIDRAHSGRLAMIGSGAALIDTTWVTNAADAIVSAHRRAAHAEVAGRAFVVSNGQPRTVHELLHRICAATGAPKPRRSVPTGVATRGGRMIEKVWESRERTDDPPMTQFLAEQLSTAHWFDQRQTRAALQWSPQIGLEEGFRQLAEHHGQPTGPA